MHVKADMYSVHEIDERFRRFTRRLMTGSCRYRNVRVPGEPEASPTCATETRKKRRTKEVEGI